MCVLRRLSHLNVHQLDLAFSVQLRSGCPIRTQCLRFFRRMIKPASPYLDAPVCSSLPLRVAAAGHAAQTEALPENAVLRQRVGVH